MIHINNSSGLGNKIKNLVTCLRFSDHLNDQIQSNDYNFLKFRQVSNNSKSDIINLTTWRLELLEEDKKKKYLKTNKNIIILDSPEKFWIENGIDFQYNNIEDFVIQDYLKYFNLIEFDKNLLDGIQRLSEKYSVENKIGVHIRSWCDDPSRKQHLHNIDIFINEMHKHDLDFILFSDDINVDLELKTIFKDRIHVLENFKERHISYNNSSINFAIRDMLVLSKCKKIIGTHQSTFTECAWWFGNCKKEIIIPKPEIISKIEKSKESEYTF